MLQNELLLEAVKKYVEDYSAERNFSLRTIENKRNMFNRVLVFLGEKPFSLETCKEYLASLRARNLKPNSIKTEVRNLRAFTRYLYKNKKIIEDFSVDIPAPKVPTEFKRLVSTALAEKIIIEGTTPGPNDHILHRRQKEEERFLLMFTLMTGLRGYELISLKGSDLFLDEEDPYCTVRSKGGNLETQPLPPSLIEKLRERINSERIFTTCIDTCNDALKRGSEKLGITADITVHSLRAIFGKDLALSGVPISLVCKLMRHSSIAVTQKFYLLYGIDEKAQVLITHHSLIVRNLPTLQKFAIYRKQAERIFEVDPGIVTDVVIDPVTQEMTIKIKPVLQPS